LKSGRYNQLSARPEQKIKMLYELEELKLMQLFLLFSHISELSLPNPNLASDSTYGTKRETVCFADFKELKRIRLLQHHSLL
jgi:hypothetical protein